MGDDQWQRVLVSRPDVDEVDADAVDLGRELLDALSSETEIRPFQVDVPDEAIADLRRRVAATRWPGKELIAGSISDSTPTVLATCQSAPRSAT